MIDDFSYIMNVKWYAIVNDLIGGYAISNVDKPSSEQDWKANEIDIGDFLTEEVARYIVGLHNDRIGK